MRKIKLLKSGVIGIRDSEHEYVLPAGDKAYGTIYPWEYFLGFEIIEIDLTVEELFDPICNDAITDHRHKVGEIFQSALYGASPMPPLQDLYREIKDPEILQDIKRHKEIIIGFHIENNDNTLDIGYDVTMVNHGDSEVYAIDFVPFYELRHCKIKLDTEFSIHPDFSEIVEIARNQGSSTELFRGHRNLTYMDIVTAIFYEVAFHGMPQ